MSQFSEYLNGLVSRFKLRQPSPQPIEFQVPAWILPVSIVDTAPTSGLVPVIALDAQQNFFQQDSPAASAAVFLTLVEPGIYDCEIYTTVIHNTGTAFTGRFECGIADSSGTGVATWRLDHRGTMSQYQFKFASLVSAGSRLTWINRTNLAAVDAGIKINLTAIRRTL